MHEILVPPGTIRLVDLEAPVGPGLEEDAYGRHNDWMIRIAISNISFED